MLSSPHSVTATPSQSHTRPIDSPWYYIIKRSRKKSLSFPNSASVAQRGKSDTLQNGNFPFFWSKNDPLLLLANNPLEFGAQRTSLRSRGVATLQ
ncbi:hypothetical protein J6590_050373 [Homalodisca vitripennis]|nr:hypothetical protein J6590_050373 [Homalodisca vitripennis]